VLRGLGHTGAIITNRDVSEVDGLSYRCVLADLWESDSPREYWRGIYGQGQQQK
jgi:hypothetical protein